MEFRSLIKQMIAHRPLLITLALLGALSGITYSFLPLKYYATGSLYVKRSVNNSQSDSFFTYEGYYSQQVALAYTNTISALAESLEIRSGAMKKLGIPVTEKTLRDYAKLIKVKKAGPQLITVTVKGNSVESAQELWEALSQTIINTSHEINANGDPNLAISQVTTEPVVKTSYSNMWVFAAIGSIAGTVLAVIILIIRTYFRE
jgi:capsular polysaccharide biosynthesis protein